jgi:hypothetical protein
VTGLRGNHRNRKLVKAGSGEFAVLLLLAGEAFGRAGAMATDDDRDCGGARGMADGRARQARVRRGMRGFVPEGVGVLPRRASLRSLNRVFPGAALRPATGIPRLAGSDHGPQPAQQVTGTVECVQTRHVKASQAASSRCRCPASACPRITAFAWLSGRDPVAGTIFPKTVSLSGLFINPALWRVLHPGLAGAYFLGPRDGTFLAASARVRRPVRHGPGLARLEFRLQLIRLSGRPTASQHLHILLRASFQLARCSSVL